MKFTDLWNLKPLPQPQAVIAGKGYRITVLTPFLLRLEYDAQERFCDQATQIAICREFSLPDYTVQEKDGWLTVETEGLRLVYNQQPFSTSGLRVTLNGATTGCAATWRYGDHFGNLHGTTRTLDTIDGSCPLEDGLMSTEGYAVLDDAHSMLMDMEGNLLPAQEHGIDLYLFCYGTHYRECLHDFYHLSGHTPIVPRYALGNWWSRYHPYTEETYMQLMERFHQEQIPLSVAVIDMNWHITNIDPKYGSGWTGYTWDRTCFPDPPRMMKKLHDIGLRVTLNDHPADGLRGFEDLYPDMAREMGIDPATEEPIPYDAASRKYQEAFEKVVLDDFRKKGVDFWWIDWQQRGTSSVPGVDELFTLNHTRYLYELKQNHIPMTFSRYGGPGSHRYPIGFSGDTVITWDSLAFQPYFTATAANIGYGWWSHDIGGHMNGSHDEELAARWVQFGVFSPIMRLHSSTSEYARKEPWIYNTQSSQVMKRFMQLRHRLLPWMYTCNVQASENGAALLRPVYYDYDCRSNYHLLRNEYLLGDSMLVCPVVTPADSNTLLAKTPAYLPEGEWVDFFNGHRYHGKRQVEFYRPLEEMPVLVKPGTIVPMDGAPVLENGCALPTILNLRVFAGGSGSFRLIEDNGMMAGSPEYRRAETSFTLKQDNSLTLTIAAPEGHADVVPAKRRYTVELVGVDSTLPDHCSCGYTSSYDADRRTLVLELDCSAAQGAVVTWNAVPSCPALDIPRMLQDLMFPMKLSTSHKELTARSFRAIDNKLDLLAELRCHHLCDELMGALIELCCIE